MALIYFGPRVVKESQKGGNIAGLAGVFEITEALQRLEFYSVLLIGSMLVSLLSLNTELLLCPVPL